MEDPEQNDHSQTEFDQRAEKSEKLFLECRLRSALQLAKETTRQARSQQRIINYMHGLFDQMRFGHGLLDPQLTREAAVELVVLLQDEEQARRIQPDLDEGHYHWVCSWMSSCAYDNLAESTGLMAGFNSPGMHECINDGIQVCRQTGKTECIKCFREYAADVYLSADDLAMVRHQCQALMDYRDGEEQRDRRWSCYHKLAWLNVLEGRLVRAEKDLEHALQLSTAEKVYLKTRAATLVGINLQEVRLLLGQALEQPTAALLELETGEWPKMELEQAKLQALADVLAGKLDAAIATLTEWDRRLTEMRCLREWFEVRLRLIAAFLLADKRPRAEALGKGLEAKAAEAQDYLTIRRWKRLLDPNIPVCPVPLLTTADAGPYGTVAATSDSDPAALPLLTDDEDDIDDVEDEIIETVTPLSETLAEYMQEIMASQDDEEARREIFNSILSHTPHSIEDAADAAYLVHLSRYVIQGSDDAQRVWPWADAIRKQFTEDSTVLSVVAALGQYFRAADSEMFQDQIPIQDLEKWFRLSLSMNPNHPRNHARAGAFFLDEGMTGDAERAFSRAFRLDRADGSSAHQLADLYRETDRPRDALAVLDICLRKGTKDGNVAWEAAMTALQLEQYDMLLTYLDRHAELAEREQAWLHYYRGLALFRLGRLDECLDELDEELSFDPPGHLHLHAIRVCVHSAQGQRDLARRELEKLLAIHFGEVDYLSLHGLVRLAEALCDAIEDWPLNDPLRQRLVRRLLRAGLISDSFLNSLREGNAESNEIRFFRVQLRQPLDSHWPESEGCLAGQQAWKDYLIDWGVLAETEKEAVARVQELQNLCEKTPAKLVHVEGSDETFRDRPGVVWQGYRRCESNESTKK
ncbi:tetratricopeptide repeat protein [Planctomicrobium piriforme]|uniref:Uncharacterized protein n=1 Tax=Planctomicrobium piriforme TaxID=1576369 RepID=A0A1I3T3J8_9PLAN|nr:hypothetical protein [Planctomicrobium piriforme]SFJ64779.1 hypothetical protein SAMN05421753_1278 [Planctomicrobium piriforme]